MNSPRAERLRFASFELDPANGVLRKDGAVIKLPPQPFRALTLLASRPDRLVTREELRHAIWGETAVDFEHGLNTCIRQIRAALGDEADGRIIETVPRLGYRFKPSVKRELSVNRAGRWLGVGACAALIAIVGGSYATRWAAPRAAGSVRQWPTRDQAAYTAYLKGRSALERLTNGGSQAALHLFEEAAARDPKYAAAYAGMAEAYIDLSYTGELAPENAYAEARSAVARALSLENNLPEAHMAAALLKQRFEHDWDGSERESRRAIDLAPDNAVARERLANQLSLIGRFPEAIAQARLGESLDPLAPRRRWTVALILYYARRYDEAIAQVRRTLDVDPTYDSAYQTLAQCYQGKGNLKEAIEAYLRSPRSPGNLGHAYAVAGQTSEARRILADLQQRYQRTGAGSAQIAMIYTGLGDLDHAFEWLDTAYQRRAWLGTLKVAPVWDRLRPQPRFGLLLRKVGFSDEAVSDLHTSR